jgi:hypothetical protein
MNRRKKKRDNRLLFDKVYIDFWYIKFEKCKMKIKKIKPTPKSIIHKKPINISPSSNKNKNPPANKKKPARYHKVKIFVRLKKKKMVINIKFCKKNISLKTI